MKIDKKSEHIEWLLGELDELELKGVVSADEAKRLSEYYGSSRERGGNCLPLLLLAVGLLFIAGGVILFFSYLWDFLPKHIRTLIACAPLVGSLALSVFCILKKKNALWREIAAALLFLSLGAAFSLVPRNYGISVREALLVKYVLALSLPFLYLLDSAALCALYSLSLFVLAPEPSQTRLLYLAALVPFLLARVRSDESRNLLFRCVSLLPLLFFIFAAPERAMNSIFLFTAMISAGLLLFEKEKSLFRSPYLWFGGVCLFILYACECAFDWNLGIGVDFAKARGFESVACFCWLLPAAVYAFLAAKRASGVSCKLSLLLGGFLLLALLRFFFPSFASALYRVFCGYYFLASLVLAYLGLRSEQLLTFNAGAVSVAVFFLARFLDSKIGVATRSAAFIAAGIFFVALNVFLKKFFRKHEAAKAE